ncbi:hypothetical protein AGMMS4956_00200 [Bacteroidia bacterium]|nr:hypothetical protein AGMMS4956_00200 [Bacteroidia bacterium]
MASKKIQPKSKSSVGKKTTVVSSAAAKKKVTTTTAKKTGKAPAKAKPTVVKKSVAAPAKKAPIVQPQQKTVAQSPASGKKRLVVSYKTLSPEILDLLYVQYPLGWRNSVIKVSKTEEDFFFAVVLDTPDVCYLIKVDVEIDSREKLEGDKSLFSPASDDLAEDAAEELPTADDEAIINSEEEG